MSEYLIMFGLFWMAINSVAAIKFGLQHESHVEALKSLMKDKCYEEFEEIRSRWQWKKAVHAHGMLLSMIAIVIGILIPMMTNSSAVFISIMGGLLIFAPVMWSVFGNWFFKPLLGLGDLAVTLGIIMSCLAFMKVGF